MLKRKPLPLAVAAALVWGRNVLQRLRRQDRLRVELGINANRGIKRLIIIFFVTGLGTTIYLQYIGNMPDQEMSWYYENLYQARINQEKMELQGIALTRYPNSIGKRARNPLSLLPISPKWCLALSERPGDMKQPPWPEHGVGFRQG